LDQRPPNRTEQIKILFPIGSLIGFFARDGKPFSFFTNALITHDPSDDYGFFGTTTALAINWGSTRRCSLKETPQSKLLSVPKHLLPRYSSNESPILLTGKTAPQLGSNSSICCQAWREVTPLSARRVTYETPKK